MYDQFNQFATNVGLPAEYLLIGGVGIGVMFLLLGAVSIFSERNRASVRIAALSPTKQSARSDKGILKSPDSMPKGVMKSFIPVDKKKRGELRQELAQAGLNQPGALVKFLAVRVALGLVLPFSFFALVLASKSTTIHLPFSILDVIAQYSTFDIFRILTILIAFGYFAPLFWLRGRVKERKLRIEESFPNTLDLLQISVEAGLGFDAAMTRVGNELATVSKEVSHEFLSVQHQVQAGRDRGEALLDMADRTGVEMVRSFANVVIQSNQFGTSISEALDTYSTEMRVFRELKAQEMANKLPVKMSAVMASLMLPALILLTIGPVLIRYMNYYGG